MTLQRSLTTLVGMLFATIAIGAAARDRSFVVFPAGHSETGTPGDGSVRRADGRAGRSATCRSV